MPKYLFRASLPCPARHNAIDRKFRRVVLRHEATFLHDILRRISRTDKTRVIIFPETEGSYGNAMMSTSLIRSKHRDARYVFRSRPSFRLQLRFLDSLDSP